MVKDNPITKLYHRIFVVPPSKHVAERTRIRLRGLRQHKSGVVVLHGYSFHYPDYETLRMVYREVFLHEIYSLPSWDAIENVVDMGANCGLFALYARLHAPNAQITCYEPQLECVEAMRATGHVNAIVAAAVAREGGQLCLSRSEPGDPAATLAVQGITVDAVAARNIDMSKVDVLKMDIEGAELEVLESLDLSHVSKLIIEIHGLGDVWKIISRWFNHIEIRAVNTNPAQYTIYAAKK